MPVLNKKCCPTCGQSINEREISLFAEMVVALKDVYNWSEENNVTEFSRKDIKHLIKSENVSARFGDWVHFGDLLTKNGKGNYIINKVYTRSFLKKQSSIPTKVYHDPLSDTYEKEDYKYIHQIKGLYYNLDKDNNYIVEYRN